MLPEGDRKGNPPNLFRGRAMDTPSAQTLTLLSPPPRLNAPRTFEKRPRLRRGGGRPGVPAPPGSLTEGQQDAAEAQHPQDPHGARPVSLKSPLSSGAASAPLLRRSSEAYTSSRAIRPLPPEQVRPLFTPTSRGRGTGNTNPPIVPHHAPVVPNGDSLGGPQFTNRSCPGAVPDARSVAPPDWPVLAPFPQSNGSAGPSHSGPPLCLGCSGL